jgi:hypothetical protein
MKLNMKELLDWLTTDGQNGHAATSKDSKPTCVYPPSGECLLQAAKAVHSLEITNRAYGLGLIPDEDYRRKLVHDLAVFLANRNLRRIALELIGADQKIIAEQVIHFGQHAQYGKPPGVDGTVMPVVPKNRVAQHRMTVHHHSNDNSAYKAHLKFNWSTAQDLTRAPGDTFECNQAKKTGGRQRDELFVSADLREEVVITSTGAQYSFCDVPSRKLNGVFLHRKHVNGVRVPQIGERWTGVLVQLPVGFQIRAARPR